MAHEIVKAVFSSAEGAGWTGLGSPIPADIAMDPRAIAAQCGATYSVKKENVYVMRDGAYVAVDNRQSLYRDDTGEVFEIVSDNRYNVENRQPVDVFESFRDELAKQNLTISHAAILRGGRIITVCAKLAEPVQTGDEVLSYVTGSTGYDKAHGTNYFLTSIRTVCANTLRMGLCQSENGGRLFHSTAAQTLESDSLSNMLNSAQTVISAERDFLEQTRQATLSSQQALEYFAELMDINPAHIGRIDPITNKKFISTRTENQLNALRSAYANAPGAEPGTVYGALQAVTYFVDHNGQVRDTTKDGLVATRLASSMFGNGANVKARAVKFARARLESTQLAVAA